NRTRDLVRMAYPDGRAIVPNFLHADLANRLANEAAQTATRIQKICLRALDYCPPVDITFGDYLRALVTSDRDTVTDHAGRYSAALVNAFRARGIRPEGVMSYSDEALCWPAYRGIASSAVSPDFSRLWRDLNQYEDEPDRENEQQLYERLWGKADHLREALGLAPGVDVEARSIHPLHGLHPDGSWQRQIVAELVQKQDREIVPGRPEAG